LHEAILSGARLGRAKLDNADLTAARLDDADLGGADLRRADLGGADLRRVYLGGAYLIKAKLINADLRRAVLRGAHLIETRLDKAVLIRADLRAAEIRGTNLDAADLTEADLTGAAVLETTVEGTILSRAIVYGTAVWNLKGIPAKQQDLIITAEGEPVVTVDDLEVAQFIYLLLHNEKIRQVLDTITSKVVLILGRFTDERGEVLDRLRDELRNHNFSPVLFDFEVPADRDITETVTLLARMARFVIADLTDPRSIPQELQAFVPDVAVPVQPIILAGQDPWAMFPDLRKYPWMLEPYVYDNLEGLLDNLTSRVINPADRKRNELAADGHRM
jgi:hypothetical protein